jgi:hypothetical protein
MRGCRGTCYVLSVNKESQEVVGLIPASRSDDSLSRGDSPPWDILCLRKCLRLCPRMSSEALRAADPLP